MQLTVKMVQLASKIRQQKGHRSNNKPWIAKLMMGDKLDHDKGSNQF